MASVPAPRGELTAALFDELADAPHALSALDVPSDGNALFDEDLQLALYCCYELHYRGLPGATVRRSPRTWRGTAPARRWSNSWCTAPRTSSRRPIPTRGLA